MQPLFLPRCLKQGLGKQEVQLQSLVPVTFSSSALHLLPPPPSPLSLARSKGKNPPNTVTVWGKPGRRAQTLPNMPSLSARQRVTIVDNLDTQSRSAGPNPPSSLREREGAEWRRKEAL